MNKRGPKPVSEMDRKVNSKIWHKQKYKPLVEIKIAEIQKLLLNEQKADKALERITSTD
jgi:hypothetical protein